MLTGDGGRWGTVFRWTGAVLCWKFQDDEVGGGGGAGSRCNVVPYKTSSSGCEIAHAVVMAVYFSSCCRMNSEWDRVINSPLLAKMLVRGALSTLIRTFPSLSPVLPVALRAAR